MASDSPELLAAGWTSAGAAAPLRGDEASPYALSRRIEAVAESGWRGIGLHRADLRRAQRDSDLGEVRRQIDAAGIERLWEVAAPLIGSAPTPVPYAQGSWGPAEADRLLGSNCWYLSGDEAAQ